MQRYFAKGIYNDKIVLLDSDIHHIKNVMRMQIGAKIDVVYANKLYICSIEKFDPFSLKIEDITQENKNLYFNVTMAIGLIKEQKMDLVLQKLTELGVSEIIPLEMERSIVKIDRQRMQKKKIRWQTICKEASEQSKRMNIPNITDVMTIKELVKMKADVKLIASTKERNKMLDYYLQRVDKYAKIIMVVGPEGGISDKEEDFLLNNGFNSVSFGDLILRVETAAIYAGVVFNFYSSRGEKND